MTIVEDSDQRLAYLEWLAMEVRVLRIEIYGNDYWASKQLTPRDIRSRFSFGEG